MTDTTTDGVFTDKWRARWPEWRIGAVFVPAAQREIAFAWFALLQEFSDAAWAGEDATPGLAKLAWWNEELRGWAKGARRHPLAGTLQRQAVDWNALAAGLRGLQSLREPVIAPAADPASALAPFAAAVARAEARLFDSGTDPDRSPAAFASAAATIAADLHAERTLLLRDAAVAKTLVAATDVHGKRAPRPRRLQSAYLHARLRALAQGAAVETAAPWRTLRLSWRAARAV
ncbi:MAG: phytoene/squalene synthase family protein [Luteimonas sp.]